MAGCRTDATRLLATLVIAASASGAGRASAQSAPDDANAEENPSIQTWGSGGPSLEDPADELPLPDAKDGERAAAAKSKPKRPLPNAPRVSTSPEHAGATGAPDVDEGEKAEQERSGHIIVPLVLYAPETQLGLGGFYVYHFRLRKEPIETRTSSLSFIAIVTTRKQLILEFLPDFYWDHEAWHAKGKLEFQKFPDNYWGIGPRTPWSAEQKYQRTRGRFRGGVLRRVVSAVYGGLYADVMYFKGDYPNSEGIFAPENLPGREGGWTVGIGPHVTYDTRDNALSAHRGTYIDFKMLPFAKWLGSAYRFGQGILDARQFVPLAENQTLALRLFGQMEYGDPPFYQLAQLGGDDLVRGYYLGRYRDKQLVAIEAEYRYPLFWLLSGVVFFGAAEVEHKVTDLDLDPIRIAGGGGLRLLLNRQERLNLRFDIGGGPHTWGAYLSATEAF